MNVGALGTVARGAVALAVASAALFVLLGPEGTGKELFYIGCLVVAAAVAWVGAERQPVGNRLIPRLIAAGLTSSALGDVLWYAIVWSGSEPNVSIADLPWFASYVFLGLALSVALVRTLDQGRVDFDSVLDAVTIVTVCLLFVWTISVDAIIADTTVSPFVRTVWAGYPVADAVLLALVVRVLMRPQARAAIDVWFGVGVTCWLLADTAYLILEPTTTVESATNAVYVLAAALMAHATWRPPPSEMPVTDARTGHQPWVRRPADAGHRPAAGAAGARGRHRPHGPAGGAAGAAWSAPPSSSRWPSSG